MGISVYIRKELGSFGLNIGFEEDSKRIGILGASGSGKSMTLKAIAGIVHPEEGQIRLNERTLFDSAQKIDLKPQQRRVGYLFQNYALFPTMTVEQNVSAGLQGSRGANAARTKEMIRKFQLEGLEKRLPTQLSGGQQQRVAIARALATDPEIIYFDEPTSALDPELTGEVLGVMRRLADEGMTMLVVTHELGFAKNISSRTMFIEGGVVVEEAPSREFFANPTQERTKAFLRAISSKEEE